MIRFYQIRGTSNNENKKLDILINSEKKLEDIS